MEPRTLFVRSQIKTTKLHLQSHHSMWQMRNLETGRGNALKIAREQMAELLSQTGPCLQLPVAPHTRRKREVNLKA